MIAWLSQKIQHADSPQLAALLFRTFEAWIEAGCLHSSCQEPQCQHLISLAFQALEQPQTGQQHNQALSILTIPIVFSAQCSLRPGLPLDWCGKNTFLIAYSRSSIIVAESI